MGIPVAGDLGRSSLELYGVAMKILLTDEEIMAVIDTDKSDKSILDRTPAVAKAQLKKVVEWGNELCVWHPSRLPNGSLHAGKHRCQCRVCWQALLKEVE